MKDLLKRLTRMVIGYGAVQWAGPFLSLIFTPIITRALTPADYGTADYLLTLVSALSAFALLGIPQSLATHFNDHPDNSAWQRAVNGSAFAITATSSAVIGTMLFITAPVISTNVPILGTYTWLLQFAGITFVFGVTASVLTVSAQASLRVRWGMGLSLTSIVATIVGNLTFVVFLRLGVTGMIYASAFNGLSTWFVAIRLTWRTLGRPTRAIAERLLRSGLALMPTVLASWVLLLSDRLFLGQYVSETELGYYAIANKMAGLVGVLLAPVYSSWTSLALALQHQEGARQQYVRVSKYIICLALAAGLGVGLFAIEILIVLTRPAYLPAARYVGLLTYAQVFGAVGAILTTGAMMQKRLLSVSGAVVAGAGVNLMLNFLLIPLAGVWGATLATVVGFAFPQIILYYWLQRSDPLPYPTGRIVAALLIQFVLMLGGLFVPAVFFPVRIILKLMIFSLLPLSFVFLRLITLRELKQAANLVSQKLRGLIALAALEK
ncbi:MAG: polysaccharide biosynthesis protein [Caldilineaceae bacterium]|nr:polysaccharide biosynthesis protein [Caldilineaceae bacterium]